MKNKQNSKFKQKLGNILGVLYVTFPLCYNFLFCSRGIAKWLIIVWGEDVEFA